MINLFKSLFKKEIDPKQTVHLIKTDIHSHLIPGIDDGAQNLDESECLIQSLIHIGFNKIITTPHINMNFPNNPSIIKKNFDSLINFLQSKSISIEIEYAAEYMLDEGFNKHLHNELLHFGKDKFLLIETPHHIKPERFKNIVFDIQMKGYKPVLAHPERYSYLWKSNEKYFELKEQGLYFQVNLNSLSGYYTEKPKSIAKFLMKNNLVDFFGSDTHHQKHILMLEKSLADEQVFSYLQNNKVLNCFL